MCCCGPDGVEQGQCVAAAHGVTHAGVHVRQDRTGRGLAGRERVVGAHQDVLDTEPMQGELQARRVVGQRVAPQLAGSGARRRLGTAPGQLRSTVEPRQDRRERSPAVGETEPHSRPARAAGDQTGGRGGCLDGHAEPESDAERGEPRIERDVDRMHENQRRPLGGGVEERVEHGVGELQITDPGADLDPGKPQLVDAAHQLGHSSLRILQGNGAERVEPAGRRGDQLTQELVLCRGQHRRARTGLVVAQRHGDRGHELGRHAFGVHVAQPPLGRPAPVVDLPVDRAVEQDPRPVLRRPLHRRPAAVVSGQVRQPIGDCVGVHVDGTFGNLRSHGGNSQDSDVG